MNNLGTFKRVCMGLYCSLFVVFWLANASILAADIHTSTPFKGIKVNGGTVTHTKQDGKNILTLSDDFKVPNTPDPHWQVIDSKGNVYLLQRLDIKGGKINKSITVPAYVPDIVKVQIWCGFAETLLGEASFSSLVM
ncbi:MAG TPA: hypothetical protein VH878_08180 [Thermodesulfobacteriota bacterium]